MATEAITQHPWRTFFGCFTVTDIIAYAAIPDPDRARLIASIIAIIIFLSIPAFLLRNKMAKLRASVTKRFLGVDLMHISRFVRPITILFGYSRRIPVRFVYDEHMRAVTVSLILSVIPWSFLFLFFRNIHKWLTSPVAGSLFVGIPFVFIMSISFALIAIRKRVEQARPANKKFFDITYVLKSYADPTATPYEHRMDIVKSDTGPIRIISAAGSELRPHQKYGHQDLLQLAWESCPDTEFCILLCHPCSEALYSRDRRVNGRFCEYYLVPFFRVFFEVERLRDNGQHNITLKTYRSEPDYRMIISRDRISLQRYGRFSHGWEDPPIIIHRVHYGAEIETLIRPGLDIINRAQCTRGNQKRCLLPTLQQCAKTNGITGLLEGELPKTSIFGDTIFSHYVNLFDSSWNKGSSVKPLSEWDTNDLVTIGKRLHIPRNTCSCTNTQILSNAIVERLQKFGVEVK